MIEWLKSLTPDELAAVITAFAALCGIIPVSITASLAFYEYRLKLIQEARLAKSMAAETDTRLLQQFTELLYLASGRRGDAVYSKEVADLLIKGNIFTSEDLKDSGKVKETFSQAALLAQVPGVELSVAAFSAIAQLANRYEILYEPTINALETWKRYQFKVDLCDEYLTKIRIKKEQMQNKN